MEFVGGMGLSAPSVYQDEFHRPSRSEDDTLLVTALIGLMTLTFDLSTSK